MDLFVFHRANQYMLESLLRALKIPADKFYVFMSSCGNTVSSTSGKLQPGKLVMPPRLWDWLLVGGNA